MTRLHSAFHLLDRSYHRLFLLLCRLRVKGMAGSDHRTLFRSFPLEIDLGGRRAMAMHARTTGKITTTTGLRFGAPRRAAEHDRHVHASRAILTLLFVVRAR
jgi:hypothetical protein